MPLTECMEKTTHRQYLVWRAWLADEFNRPSRADYYAMAIACEVRRVLHDKPQTVQPHQFELKFEAAKPVEPISPEEATRRAKLRWGAALGIRID